LILSSKKHATPGGLRPITHRCWHTFCIDASPQIRFGELIMKYVLLALFLIGGTSQLGCAPLAAGAAGAAIGAAAANERNDDERESRRERRREDRDRDRD
jgi:hypothetical protein